MTKIAHSVFIRINGVTHRNKHFLVRKTTVSYTDQIKVSRVPLKIGGSLKITLAVPL